VVVAAAMAVDVTFAARDVAFAARAFASSDTLALVSVTSGPVMGSSVVGVGVVGVGVVGNTVGLQRRGGARAHSRTGLSPPPRPGHTVEKQKSARVRREQKIHPPTTFEHQLSEKSHGRKPNT
jgi:hypothetical protein